MNVHAHTHALKMEAPEVYRLQNVRGTQTPVRVCVCVCTQCFVKTIGLVRVINMAGQMPPLDAPPPSTAPPACDRQHECDSNHEHDTIKCIIRQNGSAVVSNAMGSRSSRC